MKEKLLKLRLLFTRYFYCGFDFEGWKEEVWEVDLDDYVCCSGQMCCCWGKTNRQNFYGD